MNCIREIKTSGFTAQVLQEKVSGDITIVLCKVIWPSKEEFATWSCRDNTDLFWGHYCTDYDGALDDYNNRS